MTQAQRDEILAKVNRGPGPYRPLQPGRDRAK
jgi:hypothetical protein